MRLEKELFGDPTDPSKQHTGINFEKYDDIPVEATGASVPEPVVAFTSPPLDAVLLENIGYAMYTTPTPVQKYSIPIVANGRDLMACAQVSFFFSCYWNMFSMLCVYRQAPVKLAASFSPFFPHPSMTDPVRLLISRLPTAVPGRPTLQRLF